MVFSMEITLENEIDKKAVEMLLKAPLMSNEEITKTIDNLRKMAVKKSGKRNVRHVLDVWADTAYSIS